MGAVSLAERWSTYPSVGLTPYRLANIFSEADLGYLRMQAELFEEMEEKDPHLASVMQTRRLAVLGLERQVEPATPRSRRPEDRRFLPGGHRGFRLEGPLHTCWGHRPRLRRGGTQVGTGKAAGTVGGFNLIHPKNITF